MQKQKHYWRTRFSTETIREAIQTFHNETNPHGKAESSLYLNVEVDGSVWSHNSKEEFFADYRRSSGQAVYQEEFKDSSFRIQAFDQSVEVQIKAPQRKQIESVFEVFEKHLDSSKLPSPPKPPPQRPTRQSTCSTECNP